MAETAKEPFFSVVISCYNCAPYIKRLLDSLLGQDDDMEIIVCDDKSTDDGMEIVEGYKDRLNIVRCDTVRECHCPSNTRQVGLEHASGKWVVFSDQDDMFEPNIFKQVRERLTDNPDIKVLVTNFREYDMEKGYTREMNCYSASDTWTHGKWYNRAFLTENDIHYCADLESHEDLYFNACAISALVRQGMDFTWAPDLYSYKWVNNPDSLSRSFYREKHYYIEVYLKDYLYAASEPYFADWDKSEEERWKVFCYNQMVMALLHGYFYYQAFVWRNGNTAMSSSVPALHDLLNRIIDATGMNPLQIIDYVYSKPEIYDSCKHSCYPGAGIFVERQSFRDFVLNL